MSNIGSSSNNETTPVELLIFYFKNFKILIISSLIPLSIGLGLIFIVNPFVETNENLYSANILIQDNSIIDSINKEYFFSNSNINAALKKSGLIDKVDLTKNNLVNSFSMTSGHSDLNILIENYIKRDFSVLTKSLYFKPEEIDNFLKELVNDGMRFRVIVFDRGDLNLSSSEISLLFSYLIDEINSRLELDYDVTNINLKKIIPLVVNNPINSIDVNLINNRLELIRTYITDLNLNYMSFAPDINLKIDLNRIDSNEDLFNYVIQENDLYSEIIKKKLQLDLMSYSERIDVVLTKLDLIGLDNEANESPLAESTNLTADSTFIDTILNLGDSASSQELKNKYLDKLTELENSRIAINRRLQDLALKTNYTIPVLEAQEYLVSSLNDTTLNINNYIDIVKKTKKPNKSIVLLSMVHQMDGHFFNANMFYFVYLIIGSIFLGFAYTSILFVKNKVKL